MRHLVPWFLHTAVCPHVASTGARGPAPFKQEVPTPSGSVAPEPIPKPGLSELEPVCLLSFCLPPVAPPEMSHHLQPQPLTSLQRSSVTSSANVALWFAPLSLTPASSPVGIPIGLQSCQAFVISILVSLQICLVSNYDFPVNLRSFVVYFAGHAAMFPPVPSLFSSCIYSLHFPLFSVDNINLSDCWGVCQPGNQETYFMIPITGVIT